MGRLDNQLREGFIQGEGIDGVSLQALIPLVGTEWKQASKIHKWIATKELSVTVYIQRIGLCMLSTPCRSRATVLAKHKAAGGKALVLHLVYQPTLP